MHISIDRLMQSLTDMWQIGATPNGGVTRLALSDEDRDARNLLWAWFEETGLAVRVDDFGNMIARREGRSNIAPVMLGSHADTVPMGGRYDGILGILTALEVVRTLNNAGVETERPIEIVNWTGEEGSRFQPPMLGSWGALGIVDAALALEATDADGIRVSDELTRIGYAGSATNRPTEASAYLELHIEQGPALEATGNPVGLVQGIIGQSWQEMTITGLAGHAGANPMHLRADALVAAANLVLEIRNMALAGVGYSVATVGKLTVEPGAMNIVPDMVRFTVDARCARMEDLNNIEAGLIAAANRIELQEGVSITTSGYGRTETASFDTGVMSAIRDAILAEDLPLQELWSGAGHDAHPASQFWPAGMIFVRSKDGLSHAEAEYSSPEDIAAATAVLLRATTMLAEQIQADGTT